MELMELRRQMMGVIAGMASTGKRFKTGRITLSETAREIVISDVPFAPSYAFICLEGTMVAGVYRTFCETIMTLAENDLFTTGIIIMKFDTKDNETNPRYIYSYGAEMPYSNGQVTFAPRSTSFPWAEGTYTYMIIE